MLTNLTARSTSAPPTRGRPGAEIMLNIVQGSALRRYAFAVETLTTATKPTKRLGASDEIRHANLKLSPQQRALIDWVVKGKNIPDLAAKTGRASSELNEMLIGACDRLADHFASVID